MHTRIVGFHNLKDNLWLGFTVDYGTTAGFHFSHFVDMREETSERENEMMRFRYVGLMMLRGMMIR